MAQLSSFSNEIKLDKELLAIPELVFFKDLKGCYFGCNDVLAEYVGLASPKDCIGKDDSLFCWYNYSEIFQKNDRWVIKYKMPTYFMEPSKGANNKLIDCLTVKAPFFRSNNAIAGVQGIGISLENTSFNQVLQRFIAACQKFNLALAPAKMIQVITQIVQTNNCKKQWDREGKLFDYGKVSFSIREAQCLHYFLNHYSAEKTSKEIFISKKTVEFHLANIKNKLGCSNAKELTNLAIDYGFIDLMFMKF